MTDMTENNGLRAGNTLFAENIKRRDYTATLAAEALRAGIYTESDVDKLRRGLMDTLAVVIGYSSSGESSSVRLDTANGFMQCILYNCDTCLLACGNDYEAAQMLRESRRKSCTTADTPSIGRDMPRQSDCLQMSGIPARWRHRRRTTMP